MDEKCIFNCETCGSNVEAAVSESKAPECCDKPMKKVEDLPACETTATAEHARFDDLGEPCDDGRAGKI